MLIIETFLGLVVWTVIILSVLSIFSKKDTKKNTRGKKVVRLRDYKKRSYGIENNYEETEEDYDEEIEDDYARFPYRVTDNFLTNAEKSFYHTLKLCVGDRATICPKVGLKDIFYIGKGVGRNYMKYWGKISQKHTDFILCNPTTMDPLCGIELDDSSHRRRDRQERDAFVEKVYRDADLELIRFPVKTRYTRAEIETALAEIFDEPQEIQEIQLNSDGIPLCPKCGIPMVLRKAAKGDHAGEEFYGCPNFPQCKQIINQETLDMVN